MVMENKEKLEDLMSGRKTSGWGETLRTVIYAVLIALVVRTFAYEPFNIPSGSMIPTLFGSTCSSATICCNLVRIASWSHS